MQFDNIVDRTDYDILGLKDPCDQLFKHDASRHEDVTSNDALNRSWTQAGIIQHDILLISQFKVAFYPEDTLLIGTMSASDLATSRRNVLSASTTAPSV
jgi:hypothetical protein